jgi:hypothetical protein
MVRLDRPIGINPPVRAIVIGTMVRSSRMLTGMGGVATLATLN